MRKGHATFSNGPFLTFSIGSAIPGDTVKTSVGSTLILNIDWESNSEYGALEKVELFDQGTRTSGKPNPFKTLNVSSYSGSTTYNYTVQGDGYIRLRGETTKGKVAYTNPIFINTKGVSLERRENPVTTNPAVQDWPDVSGNIVVWNDHRNGIDRDIYMKNLSTGIEQPVTTAPAEQQRPAISGDIIVWQDNRNGNWDIYMKDISTGIEKPVTTAPSGQYYPAVSENIVVWTDWRNGNSDIYMAYIYPQTPQLDTSIKMTPGQISYQPVTISPEMLQATFGTKFGSDVNLTLIRPDGVEITPSTPDTDFDISHTKESNQEYYQIDNPLPGVWQMKIEAVDVNPKGEDVGVNAQAVVETPPTVTINNPQDEAIVKGQVEISAQAQDDEEVTDFDLSINGEQVAVSQDKQTLNYTWDTTTSEDGYYQLSAIAQDPKLSFGQADSIVIVDNVMPVAEAGSDQEADPGQELTFDGSNSTDVTEFGFTWDFGDGTKEEFTTPQVTHTYTNPGLYTVTLTVQDAAGKTATDTLKVKVGDAIPPATVSDLKATRETTNSIKLTWIAPGDDDNLGQASTYDLRYSTEPITELNWDLATQVEGEPTPRPAGTQESFTVTNLSSGRTYYFSLKTSDEVPNWSFLSNLAFASTWSYIFEDSKNKNQLKIQTQTKEFEFYAALTQKSYLGTTTFSFYQGAIVFCYRSSDFNLVALAFPQEDLAFSYLYDKNLKQGYHLFDPPEVE